MNALQQQLDLELRYSKKNIRKIIEKELLEDLDMRLHFMQAFISFKEWVKHDPGYESKRTRLNILKLELNKVTDFFLYVLTPLLASNETMSIQAVCGATMGWFNNTLFADFTTRDKVTTAAELIVLMAEADLVDIDFNEYNEMYVTACMELDEDTIELINSFMYVPPSLIPPMAYQDVSTDGSYSNVDGSCMLGHHLARNTPNIAVDALNLYAQQALTLDTEVLKIPEKSNKPLDTIEKKRQFELLVNTSKQVYNEILDAGNRFYLRYGYDSRGRMYSKGHHINIQSTEYKKALINFAKGEITSV
ncbi:MAG: hypothetical protein Tp152SUR00d2C52646391_47 [Prokaryotic dsDNA virus sp.]|nr:MAG: hypothetical protein Tp152SUR00d2C52646391_47 [Prokaryotic dsDNA virus sp.]|tara:strand:- start:1790 stop:2704 length:915 start_codon:yes stop_codon:yes gene_type:complete